MRDIADDHRAADLDPVEATLMHFAEQVGGDAGAIMEEGVDRLRRLGLTDAEILDVTLAAARCLFSKVLDATGTLAYSAQRMLEPALTVGRPSARTEGG